jgi:chromosome segregation ATPase
MPVKNPAPVGPRQQIAALQKQAADLTSQLAAVSGQRDQAARDLDATRQSLASATAARDDLQGRLATAASALSAATAREVSFRASLEAANAGLATARAEAASATAKLAGLQDALDAAAARVSPENEQTIADTLIRLQARCERAEESAWAARGAIWRLLADKRGVPAGEIPESDVNAACDQFRASMAG